MDVIMVFNGGKVMDKMAKLDNVVKFVKAQGLQNIY